MKYRGFIFDFNGVLLWDKAWQEQSWSEFALKYRGAALTSEELKIMVHGRNNRDTIEYLLNRKVDERELEQLIQEKENNYYRLCLADKDKFQLSPGAASLLDFLEQHLIPRAIATASGLNKVAFFFEHLKLGQWFDLRSVVYDDGSIAGKPAPDIYLRVAEKIKLTPRECVVVEDAFSGLEAARAAGIGYIIALGPEEAHTELLQQPGVNEAIVNLGQINKEALFL